MSATEIPGYGKIFRSNIHEQERSRLYYAHAYFALSKTPGGMGPRPRQSFGTSSRGIAVDILGFPFWFHLSSPSPSQTVTPPSQGLMAAIASGIENGDGFVAVDKPSSMLQRCERFVDSLA